MLRRIMAKIIAFFIKRFQNKANRLISSPATLEMSLREPEKIRGPIKRLRKDLTLLFEISRAWLKGEYKKIPYGSIVMIIGALLYFLSPFDVIFDFIPLAGFIDDAFVLGLTLNQIRADLLTFERWKINRPEIGVNAG